MHPLADPRRALDHAARLDHGVASDLHVHVDPGRGWIDDGDTGQHQLVQLALAHAPRRRAPARRAWLTPIASSPSGIRSASTLEPFAHGDLDDGGEVDLALVVLVAHLGQQLPEQLGAEQVDAGVALVDRELGGGGVGGLDDPRDPAGRVAHARCRAPRPAPRAAPGRRRVSALCRSIRSRVSARSSGVSPYRIRTSPRKPAALRAVWSTACPVPRCWLWSTSSARPADRRADLLGVASDHHDQAGRAERLGRRQRVVRASAGRRSGAAPWRARTSSGFPGRRRAARRRSDAGLRPCGSSSAPRSRELTRRPIRVVLGRP